MNAFLVRIADPAHQEYMQMWPNLNGPNVELNRELRGLWLDSFEVRELRAVPYTHEQSSAPLRDMISEADRAAIEDAFTRLGVEQREIDRAIDLWGWKVARAPRGAKRILSVGCGVGHELVVLRALFPEAELHGVDYRNCVPPEWQEQLRVTKLQSEAIETYLGARPRAFDLVFSNHTLEHMAEPDKILQLIHEALVIGGACVSAVPLEGDWSNPFYGYLSDIALGRSELDPQLDLDWSNPSHFWKTNPSDVAATLCSAGFANISVLTRAQYPAYTPDKRGRPVHVSRLRRKQVVGQAVEHATLRYLRRALRLAYPNEIPNLATRAYFSAASRLWFGRHRMLIQCLHELLFVAERTR